MMPANNPEVDYRALVRRSYDACAEEYGESRKVEPGIEIRGLLDRLENGAAVLDIGCGTGVPIAKSLANRYQVTGVDVSQEMISWARQNVPTGEFVCDDVMSVEFEPARFDAVVAFYSIFHIPRERTPDIVQQDPQVAQTGRILAVHPKPHQRGGLHRERFLRSDDVLEQLRDKGVLGDVGGCRISRLGRGVNLKWLRGFVRGCD